MSKFGFEATGIGSLPFKDPKTACRAVFDNFLDIPFWPQLPKRSYLEHMYCQFSEGMPGVVIDEKAKTIHIDSGKAGDGMEKAYQKFLDQDTEYFRISERYASGLYAFKDGFAANAKKARFAKGHVTGPVSFALSVTDENKRSIIYDKNLFDMAVKVLCMKARWQVRLLKHLSEDVIIFIDEPYLVSIGSSFVNISKPDAVNAIEEIDGALKEEGAFSGVHCCGNTDWSLLLKSGIDIVNFDAYNFIKEFSLYSSDIEDYLKDNGTIAWGIVPSSDAALKESAASVEKKLEAALKALSDKGVNTDNMSSIVTPSCGLGTLDENTASKILELTGSVSRKLTKA
jgi:methionine synthase II (cobalamin-independent)